jgi:hypothetical protein
MSDYHLYEKIDQYLQGNLSGDELNLFQLEMSNNSEFAQQVDLQSLTNNIVIENKLDSVRSKLSNIHNRKSGTNSFLSSFKTFSIVSLSFFLSAGLLAYYMKFDSKEQINQELGSTIVTKQNKVRTIKELIKVEEVLVKESGQDKDQFIDQEPETLIDQSSTDEKADRSKNNDIVSSEKEKTTEKPKEVKQFQQLTDFVNNERVLNPCAEVRISTKIDITPSCEGENNGALRVELDKTSGGKAPYFYSIDGKNYSMKGEFENLEQGSYSFYIEDADGCLNKIDNYIKVNTKSCTE